MAPILRNTDRLPYEDLVRILDDFAVCFENTIAFIGVAIKLLQSINRKRHDKMSTLDYKMPALVPRFKRAIGSLRTLIPAFARRYPEKSTMPRLLRKFLGLILLITTIGLSTCQSMLEAAPVRADLSPGPAAAAHSLEQRELECA